MAIVAKVQNKLLMVRLLCWFLFVIAPAASIGWLARTHNAWILGAGLPLIFLVERLFRAWVRWYEFYPRPDLEEGAGKPETEDANGPRRK